MLIECWCDGSCSPNPGLGSWAYLLAAGEPCTVFERGYGVWTQEQTTTNQRMEIVAALKAVTSARLYGTDLKVYSDSMYLVNCAKGSWKKNSNRDLWILLDEFIVDYNVSFEHVKGHSGVELNEEVDALARSAREDWSL